MPGDRAHRPDLGPSSDPSASSGAGSVPGARAAPQAQGTYFLGRYRVVDEIGIGGMASVHLARMDGPGGFQKWVAIKRIHSHLVEDDTFIQMFLDEARVAARISHPNVATVFELGKHEDTYWIAMEYLHGEPLREVMRRCEETGQAMPPEIACRIIADAAEGLHAAHELLGKNGEKLGLVHRDVTPHNLFVTYDGTTKVVDFGIAKFSSRMSSTRAGTLKGKLAYMSPEQVHGEGIDRRTDIFALGVVLWELTTGQRLFRMDNDLDTLAKVQECNVPRPSTIVKGYPIDLEKIVMKALAKNRGERFKSARELSRALQSLLMRRGLFVASDEVAQYMVSIFADRIQKREAHLRWAAEVTQTINLDGMLSPPRLGGEGSLSYNSEVQQSSSGRPAAPRPAAGMPPPDVQQAPSGSMHHAAPSGSMQQASGSMPQQPAANPMNRTLGLGVQAPSVPSMQSMPQAQSVTNVPAAPSTVPRPSPKQQMDTTRPPAKGVSAPKVMVPAAARAPQVEPEISEEDIHPADADGPTIMDAEVATARGLGDDPHAEPPTMTASPMARGSGPEVASLAGDDDDNDATIVQPTRAESANPMASTAAFPPPQAAPGRPAGLEGPPPVPAPPRPAAGRPPPQTAPMPAGMGRAPEFHMPADSPMDLEPPLPIHPANQYQQQQPMQPQFHAPDVFSQPPPPAQQQQQPVRRALIPTVPRQQVPQRDIRTELRTVHRRPPMWMVALVSGSIALLVAGIIIALVSRSPAPQTPRAGTSATSSATSTAAVTTGTSSATATTASTKGGPFSAARAGFSAAIAPSPVPSPTSQIVVPPPTATATAADTATTPTPTATTADTAVPTVTATATATPTPTATTVATVTPTPTPTATAVATVTPTPTATATAVPTATAVATVAPTATSTTKRNPTPPAPSPAPTTPEVPAGGGTGQLTVVCIPACDQVFDNGRPLGPSPIYARTVPVGSHRLKLVSGTVTKIIPVIVSADEVKAVRQSMDK
jgi:serine/threonine-protein kinase